MARIEQSIEVNVPVHAAYTQLARFEEYPRFMEDLEEVRQLDNTHLHCKSKAGNAHLEWDAEITQQVPDRHIAWRNTTEPKYEGRLELQPAGQDKTRITLTIECAPGHQLLAQHGDAESALARRTEQDLARFKKFMERLGLQAGAAPAGAEQGRAAAQQAAPQAAGAGQRQEQRAQQQGAQRQGAQQQGAQQQGPQQQGPQQQAGAGRQAPWFADFFQIWDEPLNIMRRMSEEMDQLVGRFVGRSGADVPRTGAAAAAWTPTVEVTQGEDKFVVSAELPGVRRDDVRVEIKNDRVIIEGDRRPQGGRQPQDLRRSERAYGHFYRVIALPEGAEPDAASAALHDGVLEITVPVPEGGRRGRRVDIRT